MNSLPRQNAGAMPAQLTLEKPAANLASLAVCDSLVRLKLELIHQWKCRGRFKDVERFGIRPLDRALFFGPPGNGKTMSAQLIAKELDCPLYRVNCESLLDSALGGTEKIIVSVMDWLSKQGLAVVLWDECETIFPNRATSNTDACSQTVVNAMQLFWQRLDRWSTPQIFLLATNIPERLDAALLSRIELQIEFGPPTAEQARLVVEYWTETFHAYAPETWGKAILEQIDADQLPTSFRELWQTISGSVRNVIVS